MPTKKTPSTKLSTLPKSVTGEEPPNPLTTLASSDRDRDRNRIRMELSVPRAQWLLDKINTEIRTLDIDSKEFKEVYLLYNSLKGQIETIKSRQT